MTSNANDCTGRQHTHTHIWAVMPHLTALFFLLGGKALLFLLLKLASVGEEPRLEVSLRVLLVSTASISFWSVWGKSVLTQLPAKATCASLSTWHSLKKKWTAGTVAAKYPSLHDLGIIPLLEALLQEFQWRALKQDVQIPSQFISSRVHQLIRADRRYNMRGRVWQEHGVRDLYYTHANYPGFG